MSGDGAANQQMEGKGWERRGSEDHDREEAIVVSALRVDDSKEPVKD